MPAGKKIIGPSNSFTIFIWGQSHAGLPMLFIIKFDNVNVYAWCPASVILYILLKPVTFNQLNHCIHQWIVMQKIQKISSPCAGLLYLECWQRCHQNFSWTHTSEPARRLRQGLVSEETPCGSILVMTTSCNIIVTDIVQSFRLWWKQSWWASFIERKTDAWRHKRCNWKEEGFRS